MKIGVISVQGSVVEHIHTMRNLECGLEVKKISSGEQAKDMDAYILPGGESTAIGRLLKSTGIDQILRAKAEEGAPIMGTCAGCVLLANELEPKKDLEKTPILGLMEMTVNRNAFGRQKESFETQVHVEGVGDFHGVFIRAPSIVETRGPCKPLAKLGGSTVMAEQDNLIAISFHPELSGDARIHQYFIEKIRI
ncbi:MAG: pyridoxal 5'-phosphate synthase glutaminase subunit PdxT [Candidatus Thermoplasmatota archaeon]|nr:pyridoxal 5'-phosphate synthase glutaminase subunit PdxT [Candidatus Thermoplasmatota archaeon]